MPFAFRVDLAHGMASKPSMVDRTANGMVGLHLEIAPRLVLASMTNTYALPRT